MTWPLKLRAAVLMVLHESPAMALHGLSLQFCFVVVAYLITVHVRVAILLWSALAKGLRVDAIVWLLQHLEPFVSSFLPSVSRAAVPPRFAVVTALAGAWWSVRYSRLSHAYADRLVCVSGGAIFALPCSMLPSSKHVRRHGRRSRISIALFVIAVASPRFPSCSPGIFAS